MRHETIAAPLAALALLMTGCRPALVESDTSLPPPQLLPFESMVPAGTRMQVRLEQRLDTRDSQVQDRFTARLAQPITSARGTVIVPEGATVSGWVTGVQPSRRHGEPAAIRLDFDGLHIGERRYAFEAQIVSTDADQRPRADREPIVGAAAGAVLGAVVGGGSLLERMLVGGLLGGGIGTIIALGLGDVDAVLPQGTLMELSTTTAVPLFE